MNKFKIVFVGFAIGLVVIVSWLIVPMFTASEISQRKFPTKAADLLPTLPVPREKVKDSSGASMSVAEIVFVPRVIDGDTIVVEPVDPATGVPGKQETVRYIGMDTPETVSPTKPVECYGHEASARNKELVDGKYVVIVKDESDKDKYGRLLRFVYLLNDNSNTVSLGTFVDLELVKEGFARVLTIPPNTEFEAEFNAAAAAAASAKLGFWGACPTYPFQ